MATDKNALSSPDTAHLRADIDDTRARMDQTLDALANKLTARELLAEGWGYARRGSAAGASRLQSLVREHPLPSALVGAGIAWMIYESRRAPDYEVDYEIEGVRERSTVERARSAVRESAEKVSDVSARATRHVAESVKERAAGLGQTARERTRQAGHATRSFVEKQPLLAAAGALGAGFLLASLLPSTDAEDRTLGAARDRVIDRTRQAARHAVDRGREVAERAFDAATSETRL
jgi:ElaB/YqjD/DUF883 family membrane-anchored ribosome-binding protein